MAVESVRELDTLTLAFEVGVSEAATEVLWTAEEAATQLAAVRY